MPLDNFSLAGAPQHCHLQLFVVTLSRPLCCLSSSLGIPAQLSCVLCLGTPIQLHSFYHHLILTSQTSASLLACHHLSTPAFFPNELPATQTARSQSGLLLPFCFSRSPLPSFLPGRHITNGGGRDIFDLLFCSSLLSWPLCLTTSSPSPEFSLLGWCWCSVCLFPVTHPIHKMFSSADLLEHTLLPMPVCLASPTNPSKLNHLHIYFTYL